MVLYIELHPYYMAYALHVNATSFVFIATGSVLLIIVHLDVVGACLSLTFPLAFEPPFGAHILLIISSINIHPNHTTIIWKMREIARFFQICHSFLSILLLYVCVC